MAFVFDAEILYRILEESGYDVVIGDVVSGRRDRANGVCTIDIDQAGRVKFVRTEMIEEPANETITSAGRVYRIAVERIKTVTVITELETPGELREVLPTVEQLSAR